MASAITWCVCLLFATAKGEDGTWPSFEVCVMLRVVSTPLLWVLFSLANQVSDLGMVYSPAVAPKERSGERWPTHGKERRLEFPGPIGWLAETVATFHSSQDVCEVSSPSRIAVPEKIRIRTFILYFIKLEESLFSTHFQDHSKWKRGDSLNMKVTAYCLF